tara:strand:+ start:43787 stop:44728 length:942 start_codon:yes stop_codon:yes gene_type:complete
MQHRSIVLVHSLVLSLLAGLAVSSSQALAQSNTFEAGSIVVQNAPTSDRELLVNQAVLPGYWDLGTSMRFSSPSTSSSSLDLPSIVRMGVNGRVSLTDNLELSGGFALPPKRQEVSEDPQLFDGVLMGRMAISRMQSLYAVGMTKRLMQLAGPTDDGLWADLAVGWNGQSFMDEDKHIAFSWHLGANGGRAFYAAEAPWLAEAVAGVGLGGTALEHLIGFTTGADFHFPVLSGGGAYWVPEAPTINPQTRADLYARMEVNLATGWKISGSVILGDRGQVENPETILPILEGGYDQRTFVIGFSYRGVRKLAKI